MTLIACGLLDRHLRTLESPSPGLLLSMLHRDLQALLGQDQGRDGKTDDGFEAGVCFASEADRRLVFAGAHFSLWRARLDAIEEIRGDKAGIGYRRLPGDVPFKDVAIDLAPGDALYLTTDGLIEQIGGARRGRSVESVSPRSSSKAGAARWRSSAKRSRRRSPSTRASSDAATTSRFSASSR